MNMAENFGAIAFRKKIPLNGVIFVLAFKQLLQWSSEHFPSTRPQLLPKYLNQEVLHTATSAQLQEWGSRSALNHMQMIDEFNRRQQLGIVSMDLDEAPPASEELNFNCLKAVIAEEPTGPVYKTEPIVLMEKFGKIICWFGPLVDQQKGVIILDKIRGLLFKRWFHGELSTQAAETKLTGKGIGTFLMRFSTSAPGAYTVSKVAKDGSIAHQRVNYVPNQGFIINGRLYESLDSLVKEAGVDLGLTNACAPWPYNFLFMEVNKSGYLQNSIDGVNPNFA